MHIKPYELLYMVLLGCFVYSLLEIMTRGYTHWTMTLTGGLIAIILYLMNWYAPPHTRLLQYVTGAMIITAVEMVIGVIDNLVLRWNVWDYTDMPLNLYGQICLPFTTIWFLLCIPSLWICEKVAAMFHPARRNRYYYTTHSPK